MLATLFWVPRTENSTCLAELAACGRQTWSQTEQQVVAERFTGSSAPSHLGRRLTAGQKRDLRHLLSGKRIYAGSHVASVGGSGVGSASWPQGTSLLTAYALLQELSGAGGKGAAVSPYELVVQDSEVTEDDVSNPRKYLTQDPAQESLYLYQHQCAQ
ncbi:hypothetical protein CapIbe_017526 [Capra ibex]